MTELLNKIDADLDKSLIDKGIPLIESNEEADDFINMTYSDLLSISGTKADDISFILEQRALYIQKTCNRMQAKFIQVENNLNRALSAVYDEYKTYGGFDIVLAKACNEFKEINDLNEMKLELKTELTDLAFLSKHITKMAERVSSMKWRKI